MFCGILVSRSLTALDASGILRGIKNEVCHTLGTRMDNIVGALERDGDKGV